MQKLRWGILSTAKIAREWLIPALQESSNNEVVAIASRDSERAKKTAEEHNIPKFFGSYDELLQSDDIDAIYNPLPNHLHVPLTQRAIEAGKHVLCEKPLGLDQLEVEKLIQFSEQNPKCVVMEAFMYRFHPQWKKVLELIDEGVLGEVLCVDAAFTFFNRDNNNVRNQTGIGGGGVMDIGCYCISAARTLFGREPKRVSALLDIDPEFGIDRHASAVLDFSPGMSTFYCSMQSASTQHVKVMGSKASLVIENPFYHRGVPSRLIVREGNSDREILVGSFNHYVEQVNAFADAVNSGKTAPTPLSDALANMKVIDAVFKSAETKDWQEV